MRSGLRNEQDFDRWFDGLSADLVESSHARYRYRTKFHRSNIELTLLRIYLEQLRLSRSHLDSLLEGSSSTLQLLTSLSNAFQAIELQTSTFQARCEGILAEQRRLTTMADTITQNLQYYSLLEPINRRLNAPGAGHFVRGEDFSQMLSNMDQCLEYMKTHVSSISPRKRPGLTRHSLTRKKLLRTNHATGYF